MSAVDGWRLYCRIPPGIEEVNVLGRREVQSESTGLETDEEKLAVAVGTRAESVQAPVRDEIPHDLIREAIVNAVAHRDYTPARAVQVSVFADRVEVWNPGSLIPPLTPESLEENKGRVLIN